MKAIYFIRPTSENLNDILSEIKNPKYSEYYICKNFE